MYKKCLEFAVQHFCVSNCLVTGLYGLMVAAILVIVANGSDAKFSFFPAIHSLNAFPFNIVSCLLTCSFTLNVC